MQLNINTLILLVLILFYIAFYLMLRTVINKFSTLDDLYVKNHKRLSFVLSMLKDHITGSIDNISEIKGIRENLILDDSIIQYNSAGLRKLVVEEKKKLQVSNTTRRKEASVYLGLIGSSESRQALESALMSEEDYSVKVYISNGLTDIRNEASLPFIIESLIGSHKWYREKAISNILDFGAPFHKHFLKLQNTYHMEHIELLIKYASINFNNDTKRYLFFFLDNYDDLSMELKRAYQEKNEAGKSGYKATYVAYDMGILLEKTCRVLSDYYYRDFSQLVYYTSENEIIQRNAFWALSRINSTDNFKLLMTYLEDDQHKRTIISVLTRMVEANPRFLYLMEDVFEQEKNEVIRTRMAQVLANRIEYYILKLNTKNDYRSEKILIDLLKSKRINELIGFLNVNKDLDIENRLIEIIRKNVDAMSEVGKEFRNYLAPRLVKKLHMDILETEKSSKVHRRDEHLVKAVMIFILLTVLLYPCIFMFFNNDLLTSGNYRMLLKSFVINFNYLLAYYSISINTIYIALLFMSYKNVRKQSRLWKIKNVSMMYRNQMIPSISIVAPAYNEELTVVESAKSLLNLNYPDYELIIVNDGSKDETLLKLIEAFNLVRIEYQFTESLETAPIRGIYKNPSLPRMIVVDKSNGGKADALNAGINVSNKTYYCGIDADSLLETDALLKLASMTLDESVETPALGGNIFPINGCSVDSGHITDIRIPKNYLARFQTIEYVRAFMAGRLGWQEINSLLIISGAFGLFRKDRIIGIGGYLTEKGQYKKDTVGEDMELIVRITRMMHEAKQSFKILYAFNANCWTEVPEDIKSLKNQRFRWHKGLIDILYFHKKMLFNKDYHRTGLIAVPYFLIFEAIGPMIEIQGYIMVVLAAILGILDKNIAILLFISTILMGIIVSLSALLIAEKENNYFKLRDLLKLIAYAIIENFGPRQMISFWRVQGLFNIIGGETGWGDIRRKGVNR